MMATTLSTASRESKVRSRLRPPSFPYLPVLPDGYRPKIALIGAGGISEFHLRAYRKMGLNVTHICDLSCERAEQRRDEFFPDAIASDNVQMIWDDREIEVVDIATHPDERDALIVAALEAGKHVLSQKPFVHDLDRGQALVDLANSCGRKLAVNQNGRWAPHFRYLLEANRAQLVGPLATIDFSLQWDHTWTADTPFNEIHHLILYDFAIHWFDMVSALMGDRRAESVYASIRRTSYQTAKPPFLAHVAVDFADAQATLGFNAHVTLGQEDRTIIAGRNGTIRASGPSLNEQTVQIWTEKGTAVPTLSGDWFSNGFEGTMAELLCSVAEDRQPSNSARDNLRSLELCFAAVASANEGRVVRVGEARQLS